MPNQLKSRFLNVDLEISSRQGLGPLLSELGESVIVLHNAVDTIRETAVLELNEMLKDPDAAILRFCDLIQGLGANSRKLWDELDRAEFDIGYDASPDELCCRIAIQRETLKRAVNLGASVAVSVYRPET